MPSEKKYPHIFATIQETTSYKSPLGGPRPVISPPRRNVGTHSAKILSKVRQLNHEIQQKAQSDRETHSIISVTTSDSTDLERSLGNARQGTKVVSRTSDDTYILDVSAYGLEYLDKKITNYSDDSKIKNNKRANENLVARIEDIQQARLSEILCFPIEELDEGSEHWLEIYCRGGQYLAESENDRTIAKMQEASQALGMSIDKHLVLAERIVFLAKGTVQNYRDLLLHVDSVYEGDYPSSEIKSWLHFDGVSELEIGATKVEFFNANTTVVLLDSGINHQHPLLRGAVVSNESYVDEEPSPSDQQGHGTLMAGLICYGDITPILGNKVTVPFRLHNAKIHVDENHSASHEDNKEWWPFIVNSAVVTTDGRDSTNKVFCMALTAASVENFESTSWSQMLDQVTYNSGNGRLFLVSAGNSEPEYYSQICASFPDHNLTTKIQDPAQALNALTVGAYTTKTMLPPTVDYENYEIVSGENGISPHSTSGFIGKPIKPEVVLEGCNMAFDGTMPLHDVATFTLTSLNHNFTTDPFTRAWGTSSATALLSQFSAKLWNRYPDLRPETIRGLIVHSATWTGRMLEDFPSKQDRISICGYGVPELGSAMDSLTDRATIVIEDNMPNGEEYKDTNNKKKVRRFAKYFKLPVPETELLALEGDPEVELRVTLSYFTEPNNHRRKNYNGLDLKWDIQGPQENPDEFKTRINKILRDEGKTHRNDGKFEGWEIGPQIRNRGTVQGDRWMGPASYLAGDKFVAVTPTLGWWDRRKDFVEKEINFSLIISVKVSGVDIYETIKNSIEAEVDSGDVEVEIEI